MFPEVISPNLSEYLPSDSEDIIFEWINVPHLDIRITRHRSSKLGDYRPLDGGRRHLISINGTLNKYAFFLTLVHELAHMNVFITNKGRVKPHGQEWKNEFKRLMAEFEWSVIFPSALLPQIERYMSNPKASSSSDMLLSLALREYDQRNEKSVVISEILLDATFITQNGRKFIKGARQRKRYKCKDVKTGRLYLFSPITEVIPA